jgi:hypothetical protein
MAIKLTITLSEEDYENIPFSIALAISHLYTFESKISSVIRIRTQKRLMTLYDALNTAEIKVE